MYNEKIVDIETGKVTLRDYSPDEIAKVEEAKIKADELTALQIDLAAKRQTLLDKLGITEEEARLLLG